MICETIVVHSKKYIQDASREILFKQVGLRELTNKNDGDHIREYMRAVALPYGKGYPYCAAGIYYCYFAVNNSTKDVPILRSGSANGIYDYSRKNGEIIKAPSFLPKVDDLVVWIKKGAYSGHIERIVEVLDDWTVKTIGFNTSSGDKGSQRDGGGVFFRIRYLNKPLGSMVVRGLIHFEVE